VTHSDTSDWLVGAWTLESFTSTDDAGVVTDVMGPDVTGYIAYGADGWMSVQIMAAGRAPYDVPDLAGGTKEQLIGAVTGYFAYAGPYTVSPDGAVVTHHLRFSLLPNWVGGDQKRYIRREADDLLILSGDPVMLGGRPQIARLRWRRKASSR
jgi:hypothetical protein